MKLKTSIIDKNHKYDEELLKIKFNKYQKNKAIFVFLKRLRDHISHGKTFISVLIPRKYERYYRKAILDKLIENESEHYNSLYISFSHYMKKHYNKKS